MRRLRYIGNTRGMVSDDTDLPRGVTEMRKPTYNRRGTAEQWIKEGKYALNWTRLACHRFVAN